jgi:hypothetical protein
MQHRSRMMAAAMAIALAIAASVRAASAQDVRPFATAGFMSTVNNEKVPAFGGGVLVDLGQPWMSAGAQGDVFVSPPYAAGRGTLVAQGKLLTRGPVRPFLLAGLGFGESAGPMIGGGVEIGPGGGRAALRLVIEDYFARVGGVDCSTLGYTQSECAAFPGEGQPYTANQVTVRIGVVFR